MQIKKGITSYQKNEVRAFFSNKGLPVFSEVIFKKVV